MARTTKGASVGSAALTELPGSGLYEEPASATDAEGIETPAELEAPAHPATDPATAISVRIASPSRIAGPLELPDPTSVNLGPGGGPKVLR